MPQSRLWIPSNAKLPPELYPAGFESYTFGQLPGSPLYLPVGGIDFGGNIHVYGFRMESSENLPSPMVIVRGKHEKHHLVCLKHMLQRDSNPTSIVPLCGNTIRRPKQMPREESIVGICTKADHSNGGRWCTFCIKAIRIKISPNGGPGRPTHIALSPWPEEVTNVDGAPENMKDAVLVTYTSDQREYKNPNYGYCNECRKPWHIERDDDRITDWFGRL